MEHARLRLLAALAVRCSIQSLVVIAAFGTAAGVRAQDEAQTQEWPRFHVGGAIGQSRFDPDFTALGVPEGWPKPDTTTGRKIVAGFRPARVVGVEFQLVDFGEDVAEFNTSHHPRLTDIYVESSANAWVVSALLFIPAPAPRVDVYGKVGVALLDESFRASGYNPPTCGPIFCSIDIDQTESRPYIGIGFRFNVARQTALRLEYEAIDADVGTPLTLLSLGVAWER